MVKAKRTASQDWVRQAVKLAEDQAELDGIGFEEPFESCSSLDELRLMALIIRKSEEEEK